MGTNKTLGERYQSYLDNKDNIERERLEKEGLGYLEELIRYSKESFKHAVDNNYEYIPYKLAGMSGIEVWHTFMTMGDNLNHRVPSMNSAAANLWSALNEWCERESLTYDVCMDDHHAGGLFIDIKPLTNER